ncbi:MAG: DUF1549 domain-containing protein [Roseibacillus sp.]|nr:DUF1549 domain-containing protein [Roseibacillus sp.]HJM65719.1 DUF1549 domain-containing protein [Roseibacillus sp.]
MAGLAAVLMGLLAAQAQAESLAEEQGLQFFERRIRPALVTHCYECHSAGSKKAGGKLYLDHAGGLLRGGESGPAIVPGRPGESLFIRAIRKENDDLVMPPDDKPSLPEAVVNDLVEWVRRGAPDPRASPGGKSPQEVMPDEAALWSFQPLGKPTPPQLRDQDWPRNDIDRFLLAQLESREFRPADDAPPGTLIRRLYCDLVGLAPTYDEIGEFLSACQQNRQSAVEALVDRLLASPHFGERWGRHWLDVGRYGESNGNDGLGRNPTFPHAWRYRDYVIQAFNDDVPYDLFLKQQIAGDLLPSSSPGERHRNLTATGFLAIGHKPAAAMNENFAMDVVDDQINTVATATMGLSVACARCHDHKHDPISTRDYYALAGIFRSTETLWGKAANEKLTAPATPLHDLQVKTGKPQEKSAPEFAKDYGEAINALKPVLYASLSGPAENLVIEKGVTLSPGTFARTEEGRLQAGSALPVNSYSISFWFRNDLGNSTRAITAYLFSHAVLGDKEQKGDHLGIGGTHEPGRAGKLFLWTGTRQDESAVGSRVLAPGTWNHVVLARDDKRMRLYLNGDPKPEIDAGMQVAAPANGTICIGARNDRFAPLKGFLAHLAVFDRALTPEEAHRVHVASGQKPGTAHVPGPAFAMGVREGKAITDCKINIDGNSKKLGSSVPRGFLPACRTSLNPPTVGAGTSGRLQLANWLTRGDHPQTARVMANRIWLHLFGRGLVTTPDDFGVYGARPSHPELLDHLARRFMEDGWSTKKLIRTITLSRSYQLDSSCQDNRLLEADPANVLAGRHQRRSLDAESLRDRILQAGGTLDLEPARGSAIDDLDILLNWPPGEAKYLHEPSTHRSVYLCMLRNALPKELSAFNFPDGMTVTGQRSTATPPTQALFFLNNPLLIAQARSLAERILAQPVLSDHQANLESRVTTAYRQILQRNPSREEVTRALSHVHEQEVDLSGADSTLRAWASFCQALLASNEFRYID